MKYIYGIFILVSCYACNKQAIGDNEIKQANTFPVVKTVSMTKAVAANTQNPYDYYGSLHNEGMDYVRTKMKEAGETKQEDVAKYVRQFAAAKTGKADNNDYSWLHQQLLKDSANFYASLITKANLCPAGKKYLQSIFGVITKRVSADQFIYEDIKAEILAIENRILADRLLPAYDYKELLKACSLARYSSYYWSRQAPKTKSIFKGIVACIVGICADLSALDPLCGSFLDWMSGGDFDPIAISSIMYYAL